MGCNFFSSAQITYFRNFNFVLFLLHFAIKERKKKSFHADMKVLGNLLEYWSNFSSMTRRFPFNWDVDPEDFIGFIGMLLKNDLYPENRNVGSRRAWECMSSVLQRDIFKFFCLLRPVSALSAFKRHRDKAFQTGIRVYFRVYKRQTHLHQWKIMLTVRCTPMNLQ